ncbi:hypothetical protein [Paenibacillus alvei]|nr:hypothetical protein [Paenibacillus alvei]MCY9586243.1 hypothetical protein [Paenibacillus alvei]
MKHIFVFDYISNEALRRRRHSYGSKAAERKKITHWDVFIVLSVYTDGV